MEALTGVYIDLASSQCYGQNFTWGVNDIVIYPYTANSYASISTWQNHLYTNQTAVPILKSMWQGAYHVIADINRLIAELEVTDVLTDKEEKSLIRGELLALRAFIHFDLLRMYGPIGFSEEDKQKLVIPYATAYSLDPAPQHTLEKTMSLIESDIDAALQALSEDPITGKASARFFSTCNADGYWNGRLRHMNYYAAEALKVRVLLWQDRVEEAASLAKTIAEEALAVGAVSWTDPDAQLKALSSDVRDWTFSTEQLFSLDVTSLYDNVQPYFFNYIKGSFSLEVDPLVVENFFNPESEDGNEDIRGPAMMLSYNGASFKLNKYFGSSSQSAEFRDRVPLIRLSELYLIQAEGALQANDSETFFSCLDAIRAHRGVTGESRGSVPFDEIGIFQEYVREFAGEGQLFFYEKRVYGRNRAPVRTVSPYLTNVPASKLFVYPYPLEEISYGRVQE